jgi:hypothetical protein
VIQFSDRPGASSPFHPLILPIRDRMKHYCYKTLRSGVQIYRCFVAPGGLRYNHVDLLEMKCGWSYFRIIFQRIHKFPELIIERKSL